MTVTKNKQSFKIHFRLQHHHLKIRSGNGSNLQHHLKNKQHLTHIFGVSGIQGHPTNPRRPRPNPIKSTTILHTHDLDIAAFSPRGSNPGSQRYHPLTPRMLPYHWARHGLIFKHYYCILTYLTIYLLTRFEPVYYTG